MKKSFGIENILTAIEKSVLNSDDAFKIVQKLMEKELINITVEKSGKKSVSFSEFLGKFWAYDSSPYIREKLAYGQSIGKRHCYEMICRFNRYWKHHFINYSLNEITRQDLRDFSLSLAESGLSPASINKIMTVGITCLTWAFKEGFIQNDPTVGLIRFSGESKKRGVLKPIEVKALFSARWKDKRAFIGNLLACTTGMRSGEVLAVRLEDIEDRVINIRHSWSEYDGLKAPKNGEARCVPLLPEVKLKLLELVEENPFGPEGFIFYSTNKEKPIYKNNLLNGLHNALSSIGIDAVERGIVFHSWRHYFAARMTDIMTAEQVSRITGHKSKAVFKEYANHIIEENLEEAGKISAKIFGELIKW
ncbi:MAG: site-specific integrase [Treponema sp.]|nr:site-specific integrase [Treponema sp.]